MWSACLHYGPFKSLQHLPDDRFKHLLKIFSETKHALDNNGLTVTPEHWTCSSMIVSWIYYILGVLLTRQIIRSVPCAFQKCFLLSFLSHMLKVHFQKRAILHSLSRCVFPSVRRSLSTSLTHDGWRHVNLLAKLEKNDGWTYFENWLTSWDLPISYLFCTLVILLW